MLKATYFREDIRKYQLKKINNVLNHALNYSPFYKNLYNEYGIKNSFSINNIEEIDKLPVVSKKMFKEATKNNLVLSNQYDIKDLTCGHTTGSTGSPTKVCFDRICIKNRANSLFWLWNKMGYYPYNKSIKIWREKQYNEHELKLYNKGLFKSLSIGDFTDPKEVGFNNKIKEELISNLKDFSPKVIRGYSSALVQIATYIEEAKIKIPGVQSVISSGEYLSHKNWDFLENVFKCNIYNLYGGTEAPGIAVNCAGSRNLNISEELYFIEVLDENGEMVKPGKPGLITITDLHSTATPLIRYQIGDLASIDNKFGDLNNNKYFKEVIGREDDIIRLPNGETIFPHLWYIMMRSYEWINQFKVYYDNKLNIDIVIYSNSPDKFDFNNLKNKVEKKISSINFNWELKNNYDVPIFKEKNIIIHGK